MIKQVAEYRFIVVLLFVSLFISCNSNDEKQKQTDSTTSTNAVTSNDTTTKNDVPKKLSPEEMQMGQKDYLLPSPDVVFHALDTLDNIDWSKQTNFTVKSDYSNDYSRSFALGRAVADAFICIEAKNKDKLGETNTTIFSLAKQIGLEKSLNEQKSRLATLFQNADMDSLKHELGKVHDEITNTLKTQMNGGDDYLTLASIGGWIEGTSVLSNILSTTNYSEQGAGLIKQPGLLNYLITSLNNSKAQFAQKAALQQNLQSLMTLLNGKDALTKENLAQINTIANTIINQFN